MIIGIDPGKSGGIATITLDGQTAFAEKIPKTERDACDLLRSLKAEAVFLYLEKVAAMPGQGVSSTFNFGMNYGFLRGLITALEIPFEEVLPSKWQGALSCRPRKKSSKTEHKNALKQKAQQLFPRIKMTHAIADALLIAEYGRRLRTGTDAVHQAS